MAARGSFLPGQSWVTRFPGSGSCCTHQVCYLGRSGPGFPKITSQGRPGKDESTVLGKNFSFSAQGFRWSSTQSERWQQWISAENSTSKIFVCCVRGIIFSRKIENWLQPSCLGYDMLIGLPGVKADISRSWKAPKPFWIWSNMRCRWYSSLNGVRKGRRPRIMA